MNIKDVILYSTGCPNCKVLKKKLDEQGIDYEENHSVDEMIGLGFTNAPVLKVGGNVYGFKEAIQFIKTCESGGTLI